MNVVATRTGVEHHASNDNVKTLCGRKATAKFVFGRDTGRDAASERGW